MECHVPVCVPDGSVWPVQINLQLQTSTRSPYCAWVLTVQPIIGDQWSGNAGIHTPCSTQVGGRIICTYLVIARLIKVSTFCSLLGKMIQTPFFLQLDLAVFDEKCHYLGARAVCCFEVVPLKQHIFTSLFNKNKVAEHSGMVEHGFQNSTYCFW